MLPVRTGDTEAIIGKYGRLLVAMNGVERSSTDGGTEAMALDSGCGRQRLIISKDASEWCRSGVDRGVLVVSRL